MKYKLQYIVLFISILLLSCNSEFESINKNPNLPELANPQYLLTNIIAKASNLNAYEQGFRLGNYLAQYAASVEFERIDRYEMGTNSEYWNAIYRLLSDINSMQTSQNSNDAYQAIGDILQCYLFSQLTDMWGDIPYTEAIQGLNNQFTPKYDTQESIYINPETGILARLKFAATQLSITNNNVSGDILYSGDLDKWIRFANSLRVRYYIRISKRITDFSELQSIVDSNKFFRSNQDNASVAYLSEAPNQFPMFTAGLGLYQEHRMTKTIDSILKDLDDTRIGVFYKPTQESLINGNPKYVGLKNGQSRETIASQNINLNNISLFGSIFRDVPDGVEAQFMSYSELMFALSEAVIRGYISGNANTYYQQAIAASYEYYKVNLPSDYFMREKVSLDTGDAITKILTQKWASLISVGHEGWFSIRRTGIPKIQAGPDNLNNGIYPVRYLYPESEQATNSVNYQIAVERIGGNTINSIGWWEK